MSTIEEQLWDYIDGNCTAIEKEEIEAKIAFNIQYHTAYQELLAVHKELNTLDFEEPSMSFTRNVMEQVDLELKPVALKTKVDNRIIYSIGAFFVLFLLGIFGYAIAKSDINFSFNPSKTNLSFNVDKLITPVSIQLFIVVDIVLALIYLDSYLRKGKDLTQKKGG